jgi:hypothetical protein
MTFVIDLDDCLLKYDDIEYKNIMSKYSHAKPDQKEIDKVNNYYNNGHTIIIHTGRNWDKYGLTKKQLLEFNISHDTLVMGKPQGFYIDPDSYKSMEEFDNDFNCKP